MYYVETFLVSNWCPFLYW